MLSFLKNFARTERRSEHGLPSVKQFRAILDRERSRADRTKSILSLIAFDMRKIANLDRVLRNVADCLQERLRVTDDFGMLDANSVGVLLPDTDSSGAAKVAAEVQEMLDAGVGEQITCEIYEYPSDELPDEVRESQDSLPQAEQPARPMVELLCQPLPYWKRGLDILGAGFGICVLSPLLLVVGLAIRVSSPGPIFFCQKRNGLGGKPFWMYKFRSMVDGAEEQQSQLVHLNEQDGPAFKLKQDPRVTPIGRFIRATSIDELPQLWNVLLGDMSMVGPRPLPCEETVACKSWHRRRLDVKPGLTCLWQVTNERSSIPFEEWVRMDVRYLKRFSLVNDMRLLAQTLLVVFRGKG